MRLKLLQQGIALILGIALLAPAIPAYAETVEGKETHTASIPDSKDSADPADFQKSDDSLKVALERDSDLQPASAYAMMSWVNSMGIVEQLQTIHRYSQSSSYKAVVGLVSALNSPFPLARRKASRSLLEKARSAGDDQKKFLVEALEWALESPDPVVQRNIVRLMADINIPEALKVFDSFFRESDKKTQLIAVNTLSEEKNGASFLNMAKQLSPYTEVRKAAEDIGK